LERQCVVISCQKEKKNVWWKNLRKSLFLTENLKSQIKRSFPFLTLVGEVVVLGAA
jgi:hypothetical protein